MKTYQDLERLGESLTDRMEFLDDAIAEQLTSEGYRIARDAEMYYAKRNPTITAFQKFLYRMNGTKEPDLYSANYKTKSLFFRKLVIQLCSYVLSNGVNFESPDTKEKLGADFDQRMNEAAKKALVDGVAFMFVNYDHVEVFGYCDTSNSTGFVPLFDSETGKLRAGVRYWFSGNDNHHDTHAELYEEDGVTRCIKHNDGVFQVLEEKRGYIATTKRLGGVETSVDYGNYAGFPIVPVYGNDLKESELVGLRESIDCYDFIKNGLANEIDDTAGFYWTIQNSGGFDDRDMAAFLDRLRVLHAASVEADDAEVAAHTVALPVEARKTMLDQLEHDIYRDAMLINTDNISAGNITATAIRAAYQAQDDRAGDFEYCLTDSILKVLNLLGIEDYPRFKWNRIANQTEETQMVMTASTVLGDRLTLEKLPFLTPEEVEARLDEIAADDLGRLTGGFQNGSNHEEVNEDGVDT